MGVPLAVIEAEIVPHCAAEQDSVHLTPLFVESLLTVAASLSVAPVWTVAVLGDTDTAIVAGGGGEEVGDPPPHPNVLAARIAATITTRELVRIKNRVSYQ